MAPESKKRNRTVATVRVPKHTDPRLTGQPLDAFVDTPVAQNAPAAALAKDHHAAIGAALCAAVSQGDYCDTDVELDDGNTVRFMGLLLELHSDALRVMLTSGMKEEHEHRIRLREVDPDTFRTLLGFICSGCLGGWEGGTADSAPRCTWEQQDTDIEAGGGGRGGRRLVAVYDDTPSTKTLSLCQ